MSIAEGLLIVIVIVLVAFIGFKHFKGGSGAAGGNKSGGSEQFSKGLQFGAAPPPSSYHPMSGYKSYEQAALHQNAEYFSSENDLAPYGGNDYTDYVSNYAVDEAVRKNHSEFIDDRKKTLGANVSGATMSPDSHDSYNPGPPWMGIRGRPQYVAVGNPTQVPDIDTSLFSKKPQLTWTS